MRIMRLPGYAHHLSRGTVVWLFLGKHTLKISYQDCKELLKILVKKTQCNERAMVNIG